MLDGGMDRKHRIIKMKNLYYVATRWVSETFIKLNKVLEEKTFISNNTKQHHIVFQFGDHDLQVMYMTRVK